MSENIESGKQGRRAFIAKLLNGLSGLIGLLVFARVIGPNGLGTYYAIISVLTIYKSGIFGIGTGIEHKISSSDDAYKNSQISVAGIIIAIFISSIVISIFLLSYYIGPDLNILNIQTTLAFLIAVFIFQSSTGAIVSSCYTGFGYPASNTLIYAGVGYLQTIFQVLFVLQMSNGVMALLLGSMISSMLGTAYILIIKQPFKIVLPRKIEFKQLYNYVKWSATSETVASINNKSPSIILAIVIGPTAVGIYEVCIRIAGVAKYPAGAITSVIVVGVSQNSDDKMAKNEILHSLGNYASILSVPLIFGSIAVGSDLLSLLSEDGDFVRGSTILIGCAFYVFLNNHSTVLASYLNGVGNPSIPTKSTLLSSGFVLLSGIISVSYIGINGILIALIGGEVIRLSTMYYIGTDSEIRYVPTKVSNQLFSALCMIVLVYLVKILTGGLVLSTQFGVIVISGVLTYSIVMYSLDSKIRQYTETYVKLLTDAIQ